MIRRANEILSRLENPQISGQSNANDGEQLPEQPQQAEESRNVPLEPSSQESPMQESSAPESSQEPSSIPAQSDSDSLNVFVKHKYIIAINFILY